MTITKTTKTITSYTVGGVEYTDLDTAIQNFICSSMESAEFCPVFSAKTSKAWEEILEILTEAKKFKDNFDESPQCVDGSVNELPWYPDDKEWFEVPDDSFQCPLSWHEFSTIEILTRSEREGKVFYSNPNDAHDFSWNASLDRDGRIVAWRYA